jgi:hypothetical protein
VDHDGILDGYRPTAGDVVAVANIVARIQGEALAADEDDYGD